MVAAYLHTPCNSRAAHDVRGGVDVFEGEDVWAASGPETSDTTITPASAHAQRPDGAAYRRFIRKPPWFTCSLDQFLDRGCPDARTSTLQRIPHTCIPGAERRFRNDDRGASSSSRVA